MKNYELTCLISSQSTEEEIKEFQGRINSLIKEIEGKNETIGTIKKRLASPIKKNSQAYLITFNFGLNPDKLTDLKNKLKEEKKILRYIVFFKKPQKMTASKRPSVRISKKTSEPKKKVELKEIEKKLEEILEE